MALKYSKRFRIGNFWQFERTNPGMTKGGVYKDSSGAMDLSGEEG